MSKSNLKIASKTISTGAIALSSNYTDPEPVLLSEMMVEGYFSIQGTVTGDGTAKIEYELSNDGITYVEPESATDIITGLTKTSGPGSDGKFFEEFNPELALYLRLKVTETGGANSVTLALTMAIQ